VQGCHPLVAQVVVDVDDPRHRALPLILAQPAKVGVGVDLSRARALDHEADVVPALERIQVGGDQQLRRLPLDQPAHEQEARALRGVQRIPLTVGSEQLGVDPVRHHRHPVRLDSAGHIHALHVLARHPHLIHVPADRIDPLGRDGAELPRLDHGQPRGGRPEVVRPLVAHLDLGGMWQRRVEGIARAEHALKRDPVAGRQPAAYLAVDPGQTRLSQLVAVP
jgi:hypothetical protein